MKAYYKGFRIYLLAGTVVFLLNSCGNNEESGGVSYKIGSTNLSVFSDAILNSIKSAVSRQNNQVAFHQINNYLIENQFTASNGDIVTPHKTETDCTSNFFNGAGKLIQSGDIQSGQMTFTNFCITVQNEFNAFVPLIVNGFIDYTTDIANNKTTLFYDILSNSEFEKHIYFGRVAIDFLKSHDSVLVNRYIDESGLEYYTDALGVSGDIEQGYNVAGGIKIGQQGSIYVQTRIPLVYSLTCGFIPEKGKIVVTAADIDLSMQSEPGFCQIKLCSTAINDTLEACITL